MRNFCVLLRRRPLVPVACVIPVGLLVLLGCSPDARERAKHFFFEIPEETESDVASKHAAPSPEERSTSTLPPRKYASVHRPYKEQRCSSCHDSAQRMQVRSDLADACTACHPRYFSSEVAHGPVTDGECTACHHLHRSERPHLLKQRIVDMCAECHDPPEDLSEEAHSVENVENCTACHDPHFGEDMLLKTER